jgi:hypothetical protein
MRLGLIALLFALCAMPLPAATAAEVTLAWDANNEPDLDGYKVYYGSSSGNYSNSVDVGNVLEHTISGLQEGVTYYFAAKAYDTNENESGYSEEITHTIAAPNSAPATPATPSGPTSGLPQTGYSFSTTATDPDGDPLEYQYYWEDGPLSSWGVSSRSHSWSAAGTYCVTARARDSQLATSAWSPCHYITVAVETHTITATAGANGSLSPSGSVVVNNGANRSFTINPSSSYHVTDVIVDGGSVGAQTSYTFTNVTADHTISASFALDNQPPIAKAGPDQTVTEGSPVSLNGSGSTDPGGSIVQYRWAQTAGIPVSLSNANSATATFTAPAVGFAGETLRFRLTVTDNGNLTDVDYCNIDVTKEEVIDSDGDGVPDEEDAFPFDPDEWLDTDGDGTGNNADEDDDDDGMPDIWEEEYGLDPLKDDADEDADEDGVSNEDEYVAGTDPTEDDYNDAPDAPLVLAPRNYDLVALIPTLQTDDFYDPDPGDTHRKTQWRIFDELSNECVMDIKTTTALTSIEVPQLILDENTTYYCKVRFFDNHGKASEWSDSITFETDLNLDDNDGNGIPDLQELLIETDMDSDGTPDADQDDIKCIDTPGSKDYLCISAEQSPSIASLDSVAYENPDTLVWGPDGIVPPEAMQFGLIHFKLRVSEPGDEVAIKIYLSQKAEDDSSWYKYDSVEKSWYDISEYALFDPGKKSLTLTITDGGFADADGIANGIIVDPSGVGLAESSEDDSALENLIEGIGLSCFITTAAHQPANSESTSLWGEIRGRELAIIFIVLVLIYAGRLAVSRIRHMRMHIR